MDMPGGMSSAVRQGIQEETCELKSRPCSLKVTGSWIPGQARNDKISALLHTLKHQ